MRKGIPSAISSLAKIPRVLEAPLLIESVGSLTVLDLSEQLEKYLFCFHFNFFVDVLDERLASAQESARDRWIGYVVDVTKPGVVAEELGIHHGFFELSCPLIPFQCDDEKFLQLLESRMGRILCPCFLDHCLCAQLSCPVCDRPYEQ